MSSVSLPAGDVQNVVIIGAGRVGQALGENLTRLGRRVRYAVRAGSERALPDGVQRVDLGPAAVSGADLVLLTVPFGVAADVVGSLDLPPGAVLVDATNPFGAPVPGGYPSGAAVVAAAAGGQVHLVKAFNVLGAEHMAHPELPDGYRPLLPVAGDDSSARRRVIDLAATMGFDAVDVGDLAEAAVLEEAARYWGLLAFGGGRGRGVVLVAHDRPVPEPGPTAR